MSNVVSSILPKSQNGVIALIIAIVCACIAYQYTKNIEGMSVGGGGNLPGGTGGAESYAARIKEQVIKLQDVLLVDKYKDSYEHIIISLDDLINNTMLAQVLSVDPKDPSIALADLASLHQSKLALNSVMKFVGDS